MKQFREQETSMKREAVQRSDDPVRILHSETMTSYQLVRSLFYLEI